MSSVVCCNINVHYTKDGNKKIDARTIVTTEVAVAFGVDPAKVQYRDHYRVWDAGATPCFALEIASPYTVGDDLRVKPKQYAELGVQEYWRFDPTCGDLLDPPLQGERLVSGVQRRHHTAVCGPPASCAKKPGAN